MMRRERFFTAVALNAPLAIDLPRGASWVTAVRVLGIVATLLGACAAPPPAVVHPATPRAADIRAAPQAVEPAPVPVASAAVPRPDPPAGPIADGRRPFETRYARFLPARWEQLPGWHDDDLADAWRAFLQSCAALGKKPGWTQPCERAGRARQGGRALQDFFEHEFELYEIRNADQSAEGVITGYYEPLVAGSRSRQGPYVYPVHGEPPDLLTLDVRLWPKAARDRPIGARIEGRQVIPVLDADAPYVVSIGALAPNDRDKKFRLRRDGRQLVPYYTRAEIARDGLSRAPVLAWVDNPVALYSMQIQGSGKVRFADGHILRLAYAEQNGQPFTPPLAAGASNRPARVVTRGAGAAAGDGEDEDTLVITRGGVQRAGAKVSDADVERMIEQLSGGARPTPVPPAARRDAPLAAPGRSTPGSGIGPAAAPLASDVATSAPPSPQAVAAILTDPSYVFFRPIPDGPGGPIGALGVPLTAGRSVAIDPRTTPLGFPVYLSATRAGEKTTLNRLVMAQDTGGAIRGAVRADYFWGFGASALAEASRMKDSGRMWLLLPVGQRVAARDDATVTRGRFDPASAPECVVSDPDLCVEDAPD